MSFRIPLLENIYCIDGRSQSLGPSAGSRDLFTVLSALLPRKNSSSIKQAQIIKTGELCEKCKKCLTWLLTLDYHQEGYWTKAFHGASSAFHYDDFAAVRRSAEAGCYLCGQIARADMSRLILPQGGSFSKTSRCAGRVMSRRPTLGPTVPYLFHLEYPEDSGPEDENAMLNYKLQLRNLIAAGMSTQILPRSV